MAINVNLNGQDTVNIQTYYGTVGTTAAAILSSLATTAPQPQTQVNLRQFLQITAPAGAIAFTLDGTTPVVAGQGTTLNSLSPTIIYDVKVPQGPINVVASSGSTPYTVIVM